MFLLILSDAGTHFSGYNFTFQYVSINTVALLIEAIFLLFFTFQYVSINTQYSENSGEMEDSLHSNMFLLILFLKNSFSGNKYLYIPICFY